MNLRTLHRLAQSDFSEFQESMKGYKVVVLKRNDKLTFNELLEIVSHELGVHKSSIKNGERREDVKEAKFIFSHLAHSMGYHAVDISRYLNKMDRTSILHHIRQVNNWLEVDVNFRNKYNRCARYTRISTT